MANQHTLDDDEESQGVPPFEFVLSLAHDSNVHSFRTGWNYVS